MKLTKRLRQIGKSQCVIIDKSILDALGVAKGDFVEIDVKRIDE